VARRELHRRQAEGRRVRGGGRHGRAAVRMTRAVGGRGSYRYRTKETWREWRTSLRGLLRRCEKCDNKYAGVKGRGTLARKNADKKAFSGALRAPLRRRRPAPRRAPRSRATP
jgi:hypothetical protein